MPDKKKILIVDDDPNVHEILKLMLERGGYQVFSSLEAGDAPAAARQLAPDLVILDIMMPAGGGVSVYRKLKRDPLTRDIPVLVHSSVLQETLRESLPEIDELPMIQKPADLGQFLELVDKTVRPG